MHGNEDYIQHYTEKKKTPLLPTENTFITEDLHKLNLLMN